jgi:uncharacterized protein YlxP (DUF503 family)
VGIGPSRYYKHHKVIIVTVAHDSFISTIPGACQKLRIADNLYMHVATCVITLQLYGADSLKAKRRVVKPLLSRLPKQFNVAVAEIDCQDSWQTAVIALVTVGNDPGYLHGLLERSVNWIETNRPDAIVEQYSIELL